jgi:hypothetical protein
MSLFDGFSAKEDIESPKIEQTNHRPIITDMQALRKKTDEYAPPSPSIVRSPVLIHNITSNPTESYLPKISTFSNSVVEPPTTYPPPKPPIQKISYPSKPRLMSKFKLHFTMYRQEYLIYVSVLLIGIICGRTIVSISKNDTSNDFASTGMYNGVKLLGHGLDATLNQEISFPLPEGFSSMTRPNNRKMIQHFFLNSLRSLIVGNGGPIDSFRGPEENVVVIDPSNLTPDQFLREFVLKSRPVVLKGYAKDWKASSLWLTDDYFIKKIGKKRVKVEVSDTNLFMLDKGFIKRKSMLMKIFLKEYMKSGRKQDLYLAQKSMIKLRPIRKDIPRKPAFITDHYKYERTNIWWGSGGQITPMHNDMQENLFCQIIGTRKIKLYDPFQTDLLYTDPKNSAYTMIDPEKEDLVKYPLSKYAKPVNADIQEGDCLFIPSSWYHYVKSGNTRNIAVSWWFLSISNVADISIVATSTHIWHDPNLSKNLDKNNRKRKNKF